MALEQKQTRIEIEPTGLIFTETVTIFTDGKGNEIGRSPPHRVPFEPAKPGTSERAFLPDDPYLAGIAKAAWTPSVVASFVVMRNAAQAAMERFLDEPKV